MGFRCLKCKSDVELDTQLRGVRCPYCGHRVLVKKRPANPKEVKAR